MKRIVACLLCIAVALAFPAEGRGDELTVGVPVDRCPVFYRDAETNEIVGIGADLMRVAAEDAGYDVTFAEIGEVTLKEALDNDEYDVVMPFGSAISSASGQPTVVSDNLFQTPFTLVSLSRRELPLLNDLKVGMLASQGGVAETVRQLYPGIQISLYDSMPDCVRALRSGAVDALLHNSYTWSYVLQKPSYSDLVVQPLSMFTMDFRAGAPNTPAGRATIQRLDEGINSLEETQRQAIILDYTSRRLYQYDLGDYLHQYGLALLLVALLIASLIVIVVQRQRTYRLEQEERMRWLVDHDQLTGVLSMAGFRKRVEELLREHPDVPYYLVYNNIKGFKFINDSLGMEAGDELLRFWTSKSQEHLSDEEAMGRISGDHFVVLRVAEGDEQILQDQREVVDLVRNYFSSRSEEMRVRVCSGVYVLTPEDYQHIDVDHMLDLARVAEKKVRNGRKDGYEFYNPDQWERGKRIAYVSGSLPVALRSNELQVWYQPQVDFGTGQIVGMEALCRWNHGKRGWISPSEFVPVLEESGLISELDKYVWDRVCQDLRRWNEQGERRSVSVNLSRIDIRDDHTIPEHFGKLLQTYGLTPDQLHVEITETAYVEDPALLINTTTSLQDLGIKVEMDDFGSGYSSLNMLKEVPVDRIKLDLRLLTDVGDPQKGHTIVGYLVKMIRSLGMGVIAEGVESLEQADFLQSQGCSQMQGFYFYRPMPVEDLERILG